jgi:hypothetical protein
MEREAEIEQIKQELSILQDRYSLYRRVAWILRSFFMVLMPVLAIVALAFAIKLFLFDTLYGIFFIGAVLLFIFVIILLVSSSNLRWIDVASPFFRSIYYPDFFYPDLEPRFRSEAELIERQIADRERRLSELGESTASYAGTSLA